MRPFKQQTLLQNQATRSLHHPVNGCAGSRLRGNGVLPIRKGRLIPPWTQYLPKGNQGSHTGASDVPLPCCRLRDKAAQPCQYLSQRQEHQRSRCPLLPVAHVLEVGKLILAAILWAPLPGKVFIAEEARELLGALKSFRFLVNSKLLQYEIQQHLGELKATLFLNICSNKLSEATAVFASTKNRAEADQTPSGTVPLICPGLAVIFAGVTSVTSSHGRISAGVPYLYRCLTYFCLHCRRQHQLGLCNCTPTTASQQSRENPTCEKNPNLQVLHSVHGTWGSIQTAETSFSLMKPLFEDLGKASQKRVVVLQKRNCETK